MQTATGVLCAELVKDFLEFYKLDYTLAIYMPEVNLNQQNSTPKEELARKIGVNEPSAQKPLMAQLLESFLAGGGVPAPSYASVSKKDEEKSIISQAANLSNKSADKVEPYYSQQPEKKSADN